MSRLLDRRFRYIPAAATSVSSTWERFGFKVRTADEQKADAEARLAGKKTRKAKALPANVTPIKRKVAK